MRKAIQIPNSAVRLAIVETLSKTTHRESIAMLIKHYQKDTSPQIRAAALETLAALDPQKSLVLARKEGKSKTLKREMLYNMLSVFRQHGTYTDVPKILDYGKRYEVGGTVLWSLLQILERESPGPKRSKMRKQLARYTEALLYDNNQRICETAIRFLEEVGDQESIAHLKKLRQTENLESFHTRATDAIKAIRSRDDSIPEKTPNEKEARIKEIEERIKTLEEDYQKILEKH